MRTLVGTTFKVNISITEGLGALTMDGVDFFCEFYCYHNKVQRVDKADMIRVDDSNYVAVVDSNTIGAGNVLVRITAMIPDSECKLTGGVRTEIVEVPTGITLNRLC